MVDLMDHSVYDDGKLGAIRNKSGIWINTSVFRESGNKFLKTGMYTDAPWGSPDWMEYWFEERRRCIEGYEVGGCRITGSHYMYLNYLPIKKVITDTKDSGSSSRRKRKSRVASKSPMAFADFWDGDYNYFWSREIARKGVLDAVSRDAIYKDKVLDMEDKAYAAELLRLYNSLNLEVVIDPKYFEGGYNMIVGKSRRKGFSYKASVDGVRNYFTKQNSFTIYAAYEKKYLFPNGLFTMTTNHIDFINEHTGWAMPSEKISRLDHTKASYIEIVNSVEIEKGFKSEIQALTFKDNADAARGKDADDIFFEESGAFGKPLLLKKSYNATQDCVTGGSFNTGMITVFGTSGDMGGGTADYADMFSKPAAFDFLPFQNIWDKNSIHTTCGFFHPVQWNYEGYYDAQGNSDKQGVIDLIVADRENKKANGATSEDINKRMQEKPLNPSEAFQSVSVNMFPTQELKARRALVVKEQIHKRTGIPTEIRYVNGGVKAEPILTGLAVPVDSYDNPPENRRGCVIIYEPPVENPPHCMYKIGYDPVRQEQGTSLAALIVYKSKHRKTVSHSNIVAEYVGRLDRPSDMDEIAIKLAMLYNTEVMHENEITGVKTNFSQRKKLEFLAVQPEYVIKNNIKESKVARGYGCHMSPGLKGAGERYVNEWLRTILNYDGEGNATTVIDTINSLRLLEELIAYSRDGNFDLISALFMCMFQVEEEDPTKEYGDTKNEGLAEIYESLTSFYD